LAAGDDEGCAAESPVAGERALADALPHVPAVAGGTELVAMAGPPPRCGKRELVRARPGGENPFLSPEELDVVVRRAADGIPAEHRIGRGPRRVGRLAER